MKEVVELLVEGAPRKSVRRALLDRLMPVVKADFACFHSVVVDSDGLLRMAEPCATGLAQATDLVEATEGDLYSKYAGPIELVAVAPQFNKFTCHEKPENGPYFIEYLWEPTGAHSTLIMNAMDRGEFIGQVGLFRANDSPIFTPSDLAPLKLLQPAVQAVLESTAAFSQHSAGSGVLVLRPNGTLWMSGGQIDAWSRPTFRKQLQASLDDAFDASGQLVDIYIDGIHVCLTELNSDDGRAVLARLMTVRPAIVPTIIKLPPMTRKVIALAVRGQTAVEIATQLGRSPDTIRTHLKQAYSELGVNSRSELASIVHGSLEDLARSTPRSNQD